MLGNRKHEKGSAIVESALILNVLFFLFLGIFDFAQVLFTHQALLERVRGAIRWGAINDASDATSIRNKILYNQATVPQSPQGYLGLTSSNVSVTRDGTAGTDSDRLTVTITNEPFVFISPLISSSRRGQSFTVSVPLGMFN
jgi:Flp pilus assembly protein TadG